jgi:hypothetical protein
VRTAHGEVDTGTIKLGSIVGGGVKTGIGTLLPTGAIIGTGSHLFGGGRYAPKELPAFSWWDGERVSEYRLEPFLSTARVAMSRRAALVPGGHASRDTVVPAAQRYGRPESRDRALLGKRAHRRARHRKSPGHNGDTVLCVLGGQGPHEGSRSERPRQTKAHR